MIPVSHFVTPSNHNTSIPAQSNPEIRLIDPSDAGEPRAKDHTYCYGNFWNYTGPDLTERSKKCFIDNLQIVEKAKTAEELGKLSPDELEEFGSILFYIMKAKTLGIQALINTMMNHPESNIETRSYALKAEKTYNLLIKEICDILTNTWQCNEHRVVTRIPKDKNTITQEDIFKAYAESHKVDDFINHLETGFFIRFVEGKDFKVFTNHIKHIHSLKTPEDMSTVLKRHMHCVTHTTTQEVTITVERIRDAYADKKMSTDEYANYNCQLKLALETMNSLRINQVNAGYQLEEAFALQQAAVKISNTLVETLDKLGLLRTAQ